jgi:hypothetical protein
MGSGIAECVLLPGLSGVLRENPEAVDATRKRLENSLDAKEKV